MNTPITDAAYTQRNGEGPFLHSVRERDAMSRLELDRAALMACLEEYALWFEDDDSARAEFGYFQVDRELRRRAALSAARANFPEQSDTEPQ